MRKQTELIEERARHAQAEYEAKDKKQEALDGIDEAHLKGAQERAESLAEQALIQNGIFLLGRCSNYLFVGFVYFALICIEENWQ